MALTEKITCDQCGIVKGPANHWLLWYKVSFGIFIGPWDEDYVKNGHLCGERCAGVMLSKAVEDWGRGNGEA